MAHVPQCRLFALTASLLFSAVGAFHQPPATASHTRRHPALHGAKTLDEVKADSGVSAPFGYFDPAGLMENDRQLDERYGFYKEVEIKHGRVAMLAAAGFLVGEKFHPLFGGDIDVPSYLAFQQTPLQTFWPLVVAAIGFVEFSTSVPTFVDPDVKRWKIKADHFPGDLGFDPLGLKPKDATSLKGMATREINNGRLAMIAVAGMVAQELVTGAKL